MFLHVRISWRNKTPEKFLLSPDSFFVVCCLLPEETKGNQVALWQCSFKYKQNKKRWLPYSFNMMLIVISIKNQTEFVLFALQKNLKNVYCKLQLSIQNHALWVCLICIAKKEKCSIVIILCLQSHVHIICLALCTFVLFIRNANPFLYNL